MAKTRDVETFVMPNRPNCAFAGFTFEFWACLFPDAHSIEWSSGSGWQVKARRRRGMFGLKPATKEGRAHA
jgi:hypothetical protein